MNKSVKHSEVTMANVMLPQQANPAGNIHGGEIMKLMDTAAGVVARRHARTNVVTARVDELEFNRPIHVGNLVTCHGKLTFVGKSSMEILITVTVEDVCVEDPPQIALTAYFTLVSTDEEGRPQQVAPLEITTEEERQLFEQGRLRYLAYKQRQKR